MFLGFIAFALAFFAFIKARENGDRLEKTERDLKEVLARLEAQKRQIEQLRTNAPLSPQPAGADVVRPAVAVTKPAEAVPIKPADPLAPVVAKPVDQPTAKAQGTATTAAPPVTPSPVPLPTLKPYAEPLPAVEPATPIDWESLLGVKGAAWVGGIALIASAIFFARWTIEQGYITPELRFATMLFGGIFALVAAEIGLRRGYERTANPLSGAGIAILYIAFFAGHSRYDLISMPTAFAGMVAVTVTACVLAVRYDAFPTAVLGLIGGFVTPVALSTGEDRPVSLFSYIFLLNVGLFTVGLKRRWPALFELGLVGTLLIQVGWFSRYMSPANMLVGTATFFVFGVMYLLLPVAAKDVDETRTVRTGIVGGLAPFLFALYLAGSAEYVADWPLLFGLVLLLDLAILAFAVVRKRVVLLVSAAVATATTLDVWSIEGLKASAGTNLLLVSLSAIAITAVFGYARRVAEKFGDLDTAAFNAIEAAAVAATGGLGAFTLVLIGQDGGKPGQIFLILLAALCALWYERVSHSHRISGLAAAGALAIAITTQIWIFNTVEGPTVMGHLIVPVLLSIGFSLFAARNAGTYADYGVEAGVMLTSSVSIFGLFIMLAEKGWSQDGFSLFLILLMHTVLMVGSALRTGWNLVLIGLLGTTAAYVLIWEGFYLTPSNHAVAFGGGAVFYALFLTLPMVVPFEKWRDSLVPWLTSALSGPAFFLPFLQVYRGAFGESAIGLLPVMMAATSVGALRVVSSRFEARAGDALSARLRLRYLALFTSIAMWFIAVAIPLQLDKQWMTLGWALEAAALCWLFGRLPHQGLPVFAFVLFSLVGVRLLLNPEILRYHERGAPLFNWILYTYGIATVCCLWGQSLLRQSEKGASLRFFADTIGLLGLLLGFWLVNLEILDYFSVGPYITVTDGTGYAVKLALSAGWGLYAIVLLVTGVARDLKPLRYMSLAFLLLTVLKVFLYDLSELGGIFRVFSFLGLAVALILVSLFYQRFVFKRGSK